MHILNKIFIGLIAVLAGVFIVLAALNVKERQLREAGHKKLQNQIADCQKKEALAIEGQATTKPLSERTTEELSLTELKRQAQSLTRDRGYAWFACSPGNIDFEPEKDKTDGDKRLIYPEPLGGDYPDTNEEKLSPIKLAKVKLNINGPVVQVGDKEEVVEPVNLKGVVYLFNEGKDKDGQQVSHGEFLGRYTVEEVKKTQKGQPEPYEVTLFSTDELSKKEQEKLQNSMRSTWALYATIPKDRSAGVFDQINEDVLETLVPNKKLREQLQNLDRTLVDYDELINRNKKRQLVLQQEIKRTKQTIAGLEESLKTSDKLLQTEEEDIAANQLKRDTMKMQEEVVTKKVKQYEEVIANLQKEIQKIQKQNERNIAKIAEFQMRTAQEIEKRANEAAANPNSANTTQREPLR